MGAQITEPALIDKINSIVEDLKRCLNQMSREEVEILEKCIVNLFRFYKTYLEAKNHLDKVLDPAYEAKNDDVIHKLRQEYHVFLKNK